MRRIKKRPQRWKYGEANCAYEDREGGGGEGWDAIHSLRGRKSPND